MFNRLSLSLHINLFLGEQTCSASWFPFNQAALLSVPDEERVPVIPSVRRVPRCIPRHVRIFTHLLVHHCTNAHTGTHTISAIKEWPNRQPTCPCTSAVSGVSAQHVCSSPPCLCHVFHIKVLVWWAPAGGRVGALSQGCVCGPNPLINSASAGRRWQVGTETGCTHPPPPSSSYCCQALRSLRLLYAHYC